MGSCMWLTSGCVWVWKGRGVDYETSRKIKMNMKLQFQLGGSYSYSYSNSTSRKIKMKKLQFQLGGSYSYSNSTSRKIKMKKLQFQLGGSYSYSNSNSTSRIYCNHYKDSSSSLSTTPTAAAAATATATASQVYRDLDKLVTQIVEYSQPPSSSTNWTQLEGSWVLAPTHLRPWSVVHFIGGIFVGAAPQLAYRLFLERLCQKGILVIATPYASGFDHFLIADEVQFKFDRCCRALQETVGELPTFGIGHSLGSVIHLLIGSRYAIQRSGNVLMAFNNKDPSVAIPLFSPVLVPMAQSLGPLLSQIASSPTVKLGAEMTLKQLESLSPPIMKQILPVIEQLPPLYMDLAKGRENLSPKPEETRRLIKSYYGVRKNLLVKFKDDPIDETSTLAKLLCADSEVSSMLDMSIRALPGDHGTPLVQVLPELPPGMADAINRGSEFVANLTAGTPWETVAKDVSSTLGVDAGADSTLVPPQTSKHVQQLVHVITSWMSLPIPPTL